MVASYFVSACFRQVHVLRTHCKENLFDLIEKEVLLLEGHFFARLRLSVAVCLLFVWTPYMSTERVPQLHPSLCIVVQSVRDHVTTCQFGGCCLAPCTTAWLSSLSFVPIAPQSGIVANEQHYTSALCFRVLQGAYYLSGADGAKVCMIDCGTNFLRHARVLENQYGTSHAGPAKRALYK